MASALTHADRRAVSAEMARRSFERFVRLMRPAYQLTWYHLVICQEVQAWVESKEPYHLILSMPPGHAKSEYCKLALSWIATRDRQTQLVYASYGQDLADQQLRDVQGILDSEEYLAYYPAILNPRRARTDATRGAKRTGDYAELLPCDEDHGGGWVKSVGRGGGLTGFRCDAIALDDLTKDAIEAASATTRAAIWSWITRVVLTRARADRDLRLLVPATRWHLDDATGRLLTLLGGQCREVRFEALREDMSDPRDPRALGEALWPAVASREDLERMRRLDPEGFSGLYQQRPVPDGGAVFKGAHFAERWEWLDALLAQPGQWVQSWDPRHGGKSETSSRCAAGLFFLPDREPARAYLVDVRAERWSPEETLDAFDALQADPLWGRASVRLVEAKADGKMILSLRQRRYVGMTPIEPRGDKTTRARAVVPLTAAGAIVLPRSAPWLAEWLSECLTFPAAATDDMVDMTTQLLAWRWLHAIDKTPAPPDPLEAARARMARHGVR